MAAMPTPIAVVFDLDGTLTDTEVTWEQVRRGICLLYTSRCV